MRDNFVVAIDFDGTIVEDAWPGIGKIRQEVVDFIHELKAQGHIVIIWTCREQEYRDHAIQFLKDNNIPYDYFNENPQDWIDAFNNDSRKIGATFFLDDRAWNIKDLETLKQIIRGNVI